ncbi:MAG: tubulin-like doman-containing protein [Treponema sp.]|jgi:hypothetical protein|nr:tubulin-like doman-containing protein [Treponema sp.]
MVAPTLIVGLGGIGSKITAKISEMITDPKQKERINFVVFDTDVNELGRIERESRSGKGKKIITVQTSTNMTVGDYLHLDTFTRDNSFPINPNLYRKTLSEGAGQVRAISHLAFVTAMKRGYMEPLDSAIYDLYKLESTPTTQVLRVIIVSSLAGGTGSGLILPVSMYIKQFLKTKIQIPGSITRGFFILPEVIFGDVPTEPMRNAFRANAYAVLRELNAFILKADGNLPERYKDKVHLMFPKIGTGEFEEYDVLPMDFSFMFDAQNIEGKKLNSTEQYYDHAATCIYAQSIGPMNTRSNSSEDNVIRTLVSGQSRNRYAGAGASELVYPSDHIIRYIALKWAVQTVSEHWSKFDRDIKKQSSENNKARLKGLNVTELDPATEYIKLVDMAAADGNAFALFTRNASYRFDKDGFTEVGKKWTEYNEALFKYVKHIATTGQSDIDNQRGTAESSVEALAASEKVEDIAENLKAAYSSLISYRDMVTRRVDDIGRVSSYQLFQSTKDEDTTSGERPTQIESYLRDNSKEFMHPNAARYFLYQTLQTLLIKSKEIEKKRKLAEDSFASFETQFDDFDGDTPNVVESVDDFARKIEDAGFWAHHFTKKYKGKISEAKEQYQTLLGTIADYRVIAPYAKVLEGAVNYVRSLCESFEKFYNSFDANVQELQRQIQTSEEKYSLRKGSAVRYVCTSKKCLDKFYEKMEFTGNALSIPGELCARIYKQVRLYSVSPDVKTGTFFKDIFDNDILGHFQSSVMASYSQDIKMDIIRALEVEAEYEAEIGERDHINDYVKKVIRDTKKLSDPFINRPVGEEPVLINACAFNKKLKGVDNPLRADFVKAELKSFGGVECDDDEISTERVLFYSAIYGLFPYDLLKFSPEQKTKTVTLEAGEYNKAYFDMIDRIGSNPLDTKVITPHLHKHWHLISEMPDLSEEQQKKLEKKIYEALLYGILYGWIRYESAGNKSKYRLWLNGSNKETPLDVSNGTPCDHFYEIVDALTCNPVIVNDLLNAARNKFESERKRNVTNFEQSALYEGLQNLELQEISGDNRNMSIFGIAMAFKVTMPPDEFIDEQGLLLLETMMEILYEHVTKLTSEIDRDSTYQKLVKDQLERFKQNLGLYDKKYTAAVQDYLRQLLHIVIKDFHDKDFIEAEMEVDKYSKEYFSGSAKQSHKIPHKKEADQEGE